MALALLNHFGRQRHLARREHVIDQRFNDFRHRTSPRIEHGMMECRSDADQKFPVLMLHATFSYAFLVLAALCCQLTLTRLLRSRYDACVILTRSGGIWF